MALPSFTWKPERTSKHGRVSGIKEGIARNALPCGARCRIPWFERGLNGMHGEVKIDKVVAGIH